MLKDPIARKVYDKKLKIQRGELDEPFGEHEYNFLKQLFQEQVYQDEINRKLQELIEMEKRENYLWELFSLRYINWRNGPTPELLPERFQKVLIREKQERRKMLQSAFKYTCICGIVIIAIYKIKNYVNGPVPLPNSKLPFSEFSSASFLG